MLALERSGVRFLAAAAEVSFTASRPLRLPPQKKMEVAVTPSLFENFALEVAWPGSNPAPFRRWQTLHGSTFLLPRSTTSKPTCLMGSRFGKGVQVASRWAWAGRCSQTTPGVPGEGGLALASGLSSLIPPKTGPGNLSHSHRSALAGGWGGVVG